MSAPTFQGRDAETWRAVAKQYQVRGLAREATRCLANAEMLEEPYCDECETWNCFHLEPGNYVDAVETMLESSR